MSLKQAGLRNGGNVSQVGTAAGAKNVDLRKPLPQHTMKRRKFGDVARVELGHGIEFRMTTARCIRSHTANPRRPFCVFIKRGGEVRRMRAVDHIVGGIGSRPHQPP